MRIAKKYVDTSYQIRCENESYVYLSLDSTSSGGKPIVQRMFMQSKLPQYSNYFYADPTSTVGIVKAFYCGYPPNGDTTSSHFNDIVLGGGGTFVIRDTIAFRDPLWPALAKFCDGTGGMAHHKYSSLSDIGTRPSHTHVEAFPNPFGASSPNGIETATFEIKLEKSQRITAVVYDIQGDRIRLIRDNIEYDAGMHFVRWDGNTDFGTPVPSGSYFFVLHAHEGVQVTPITLKR